MYDESEDNRFLEVTYANGDKEVLYFRDFNSGAISRTSWTRPRRRHQVGAGNPSARSSGTATCWTPSWTSSPRTRICPTPPTPDDGARISGKKGERIVYIRTLVTGKNQDPTGDRHRARIPASTCNSSTSHAVITAPSRPPGPSGAVS